MRKLYLSEENYRKKMLGFSKSTQELQEKIRESKLQRLEKRDQNKKVEDSEIEDQLRRIRDKFRQAEANVERHKEKQEHCVQLKQEMRRLKEEDLRKERERQRRVEMQRKRKIVRKAREHEEVIEEMRRSTEDTKRARMQESIKNMIDMQNMFHTVRTVIKSKDLPLKEKSRLLRDHSLNMNPDLFSTSKSPLNPSNSYF